VIAALPASASPEPLPLLAIPVRIEARLEAVCIERETPAIFHPPPILPERLPLRI
jgi:hypothetical protein